jgi:hypothetical protein
LDVKKSRTKTTAAAATRKLKIIECESEGGMGDGPKLYTGQ